MKYQIDQSGKIEDTAKNTVIAYANSQQFAIIISKKTKRQLQELFRQIGMPRVYIYIVFAYGVFALIKDMKTTQNFTIDTEYPGKERLLKSLILRFLTSYKRPDHSIHFARIGNRPRVHYAAHDVLVGKRLPDKTITLVEVVKAIKKADGHLRECLATLIDAQPRLLSKIYQKRGKKSRRNK